MNPFLIELSDHQEFTHEADEVDVDSGALHFTRDGKTSLIVASRVWRSCRTGDTDPPPFAGQRGAQGQSGPPKPSRQASPARLLPGVTMPDPLQR
jgi:hypothetical protein